MRSLHTFGGFGFEFSKFQELLCRTVELVRALLRCCLFVVRPFGLVAFNCIDGVSWQQGMSKGLSSQSSAHIFDDADLEMSMKDQESHSI